MNSTYNNGHFMNETTHTERETHMLKGVTVIVSMQPFLQAHFFYLIIGEGGRFKSQLGNTI